MDDVATQSTETTKPQTQTQTLPKVLLLKPNPPEVFTHFETQLSKHFHFLKFNNSTLSLPSFLSSTNSADVTSLLIGNRTLITPDLLDDLPSLRLIVTSTAGTNHINLPECRRRGISVAYAADVYSDDCADYAVSLLIDVLRRISAGDRFVRSGRWPGDLGFPLGTRLRGKRIGVVGLGSIGSRIAKRLEGFGCTILYNSRKKKPSVAYPYYADIRELAADSDVLVLSCALTDETKHLINKDVLLALGKDGVIVNIARGPIIDEKELVRCLQEGKIAGAGLDVYEEEPKMPKELFALDNVVLSPHLACYTKDSLYGVFELVKGNLQAFFSNKPLLSPVPDE